MKRILSIILLCIIIITIICNHSNATSINMSTGDFIEHELIMSQHHYIEGHKNEILNLKIIIILVISLVIFNILLFSILQYKGRKLEHLYKIVQIIFLILIITPIFNLYVSIGAIESIWGIVSIFIPIEIFIMLITLFIRKKNYLFVNSIISGLLFVIIADIIINYEFNSIFNRIIGSIGYSIILVIITNILFLPLYLKKEEIKEEENVRI